LIENKITVEKAVELALQEISSKVSEDIIPMIIEEYTIIFDWGIVFCWNDERGLTKKDKGKFLIGRHEVLVDRISQKVMFLKEPFLDIELEKYRESKGYPHSIKFPSKIDLSTLDEISRVIVLLGTEEVHQINQGIKIIEEKKLFDLRNLLKAKVGKETEDLLMDSLKYMGWGGIVWYESELMTMPKEVELLKLTTDSILILNSQLKKLPNEILELKNLEKIEIDNTPIEDMPMDLRGLKNLRKIIIEGTKISQEKKNKFLLPPNCSIEIK